MMTVYRPRQETLNDYDGFVEKFKPKKTTDDCYTPVLVYDAVKNWAVDEYSLEGRNIVRPFVPGGDYEAYDYPENCVVIDNPPFSIISKICKDYTEWGVDFFLFAPHLTNFSIKSGNHIICGQTIEYANGAVVNTSFITNMGSDFIRTSPKLSQAIKAANVKTKAKNKKQMPKYKYPSNVLTVSDLEKICNAGIEYSVSKNECTQISRLDAQKEVKKKIFGNGYMLSDKAAELKAAELKAAELKAAEVEKIEWLLSDRELSIIEKLGA